MTRKGKQVTAATLLSLIILMADQIIKITVKTHMYMHQSIHVTDWFQILFTENNGMAFGAEIFNKFFLTSFRIVMVAILTYVIVHNIRKGVSWGLLLCLVLITAGAAGNIIDCVSYGMIFNNPPAPMVAEFVPWGTGYGSMMMGRVVDMFYFPLVEWGWPEWIPMAGGKHFIFFSPIFNLADACISCGVVALLIFYRKVIQS